MEKTIYKLDSKGNERFLTVKAVGAEMIQISGLVDTDSPVEHKKTCKAKNVGKANETTPEEQAIAEAEAKWVKKIDEGYFESLEEANSLKVILPMLAKGYEKEKKKIDWEDEDNPVYVQPKLDGMRSFNLDGTITSRKGKEIDTVTHIINEVAKLEAGRLDGELYAHGYSFQANMKAIKKIRDTKNTIENYPATVEVKFHVYDMIVDKPFKERYEMLKEICEKAEHIVLVPTYIIKNEKELNEYHSKFLEEGYEGTIVRHGKASYKVNARSSNLLKFKDFIDIAVKLIDVTPAEQRETWGVPVLELPDGRTFRAGARLSHAEREDLLTNKEKYIGKTAEIRFFEYTDDGIPRFPVLVGFRLDK